MSIKSNDFSSPVECFDGEVSDLSGLDGTEFEIDPRAIRKIFNEDLCLNPTVRLLDFSRRRQTKNEPKNCPRDLADATNLVV